MNKSTRIFSRSNYATGATEWFFKSREGMMGPFNTEQTSAWALDEYLNQVADSKQAANEDEIDDAVVLESAGSPVSLAISPLRLN